MRARASAAARALAKRRAASRSQMRANHASNAGGTPFSTFEGTGISPIVILIRRSPTPSLSKGSSPVTHWYASTPSAQRSVR